MSKNNVGQNMMLISSAFRQVKSFSLVPVDSDCPYVEAMFDPTGGILAVITKVKKDSFHMVPRLDDNGQPSRLKVPNKETGKVNKEQRVSVETFSEFYITEKEEIKNFLAVFAINFTTFDIDQFFVTVDKTKPSNIIIPG
tara:strand:+ start:621 stop:1040 length:420 start_codon:yes stop_codon:yes gene_type:complete